MRRKRKKVHQMRGYRRGYGSKKKHRGKGSKGGKGWGGSTKHNRSYVYTKARDHFGHTGFHSLHPTTRAINVGDLESFAPGEVNLTALGYHKLLSKGSVTKSFAITVGQCTTGAKKKIEQSGGTVAGTVTEKKAKKK